MVLLERCFVVAARNNIPSLAVANYGTFTQKQARTGIRGLATYLYILSQDKVFSKFIYIIYYSYNLPKSRVTIQKDNAIYGKTELAFPSLAWFS